MINGELIDLRAGAYEARIATSGATLVHLRRDGRDLVVPFDAESVLPAGWQGKVLVPWPNRIEGARYTYAGGEYLVPCNEPETGSALHGLVGWTDFEVASEDSGDPGAAEEPLEWADDADSSAEPPASVLLETVLPASYGYPWSLQVRVEYALDAEAGLTMTVTSTALAAAATLPNTPGAGQDGALAPAPYGVSWHPYLTRSVPADECVLTAPAAQVLDVDEHMAPAGLRDVAGTELDWRAGRVIGATASDNAYTGLPEGGWEISLRGGEGDRAVVLAADAPWAQIYSGEHLGRRGVAVEAMTCPPNAFTSGEGLITLEVGESHSFSTSIREVD